MESEQFEGGPCLAVDLYNPEPRPTHILCSRPAGHPDDFHASGPWTWPVHLSKLERLPDTVPTPDDLLEADKPFLVEDPDGAPYPDHVQEVIWQLVREIRRERTMRRYIGKVLFEGDCRLGDAELLVLDVLVKAGLGDQ